MAATNRGKKILKYATSILVIGVVGGIIWFIISFIMFYNNVSYVWLADEHVDSNYATRTAENIERGKIGYAGELGMIISPIVIVSSIIGSILLKRHGKKVINNREAIELKVQIKEMEKKIAQCERIATLKTQKEEMEKKLAEYENKGNQNI
ncbi:MAG: hypothetical protein Q8O09_05545 [Bacillota bacterium]|nr:hypothetical protein [Bacillota bacterium]